jgi:hypothetical protein
MKTLACVALVTLVVCSRAAKYSFEHSVDGGLSFVFAGSIEGKRSALELLREPLSKDAANALSKVVENDGCVHLSLKPPSLCEIFPNNEPHALADSTPFAYRQGEQIAADSHSL